MLERKKSGKLITVAIIFFKAFLASVSGLTFSSEIVNLGADKILKCDWLAAYWKRGSVDIFDGHVIIKGYNKTFEVDNTTFNNDLKINRITFEEAGEYWCMATDTGWISSINVVVIDKNISCEVITASQSIPLQPTEHFNINCSIIFNASDSCEVKPLWTEKLSNKNLTSEISSGYSSGYMWLTANGNNGLKNAIFWLRVTFTCNVSATNINDWKVVESIYDTNYISPEIKFSNSLWPTHGQWILILMSVAMFVISFLLIFAIICERYRASRPKQPRNKSISKFPEIRRVIKNSIARNQSPKHRGIEEDKITPYYTFFEFNKRPSFEIQLEKKANKSRNQLEEVSAYDMIDADDPKDNYELCD